MIKPKVGKMVRYEKDHWAITGNPSKIWQRHVFAEFLKTYLAFPQPNGHIWSLGMDLVKELEISKDDSREPYTSLKVCQRKPAFPTVLSSLLNSILGEKIYSRGQTEPSWFTSDSNGTEMLQAKSKILANIES